MAKIEIVLDAGHYGKYNRSPVYAPYWESEMTWKLYQLLRKELEAYGDFQVTGTRSDPEKDMPVYDRGKAAKGAELLLSLHSNAASDPETDYPVAIVQLDGKGDKLGQALASCVDSVMGTKQQGRIWTRANDAGGEYYGVLRGAKAVGTVAIILEHSFHTNARAAKWLYSDANLAKLAKAEAKVIAAHYGVKAPGQTTTATQPAQYALQYVVQAGAYTYQAAAASTQAAIKRLGLPVSLEYISGLHKLLVGPYAARKDAEAAQKKLLQAGMTSFIWQRSTPLKSTEEVAREVIRGDWGVGQDRKDRLTAAGYDYTAVQTAVNKLMQG